MVRKTIILGLIFLSSQVSAHPIVDKAMGGCEKDWIPASCVPRLYTIYKAVGRANNAIEYARLVREIKARDKALAKRRVGKIKGVIKKAWRYSPQKRGLTVIKIIKDKVKK